MRRAHFPQKDLALRIFGSGRGEPEMKRMLSLSLMCALTLTQSALGAQVQAPGVTGTVLQSSGVISGTASSSSGRPLSNITMQLIDPLGVPAGKAVTSQSGDFSIPGVAYGTYTLQCIQMNKVIGTSSVTLQGPTESVRITCTSDAAAFWTSTGVFLGLAAAAVAVGAAAVTSSGGAASDASGSR